MPNPLKTWRPLWALALLSALLVAGPAVADTPVEDAIKAWVGAVDADPGWKASYTDLAVDPATGVATVSGLSVRSEQPGFALDVATLKVEGFHPSTETLFGADEIDLTDAALTVGSVAVALPSAVIAAPVLPETSGFTWDPANPALSAVHALSALVNTAAASIKAPSVAVSETVANVESRTTYSNVSLVGWRNGKIAATTAGPVKSVSPASAPLVTLAAASAVTRDVDLKALVSVLDPAAYPNGAGDGVWRQVVGHSADHQVALALPGVSLSIDDVSADGVRLRQSKVAPNAADATADAAASLLDHALHKLDQLSDISVDRLALAGIGGAIPGVVDGHLDTLTIAGVEGEKIGDIAVSGLAVNLAGNAGSVKLAGFGLGGLALPPPDAIRKAAADSAAGAPVDYARLIPPITRVEVLGLNVAFPDVLAASLDRFRLDLGNYTGVVPKTVALDLAAADLPAALLPSDRARELLARLGYGRLHLDAGLHAEATAANQIAVKDFHFAMKDAGGISGNASLVGSLPAGTADAKQALESLAVRDGTLTVTDDSIVGRLIAAQAAKLNVDPEKFRQQFATGLPFMLMFLNNRDLLAKLTPALQGFIRNGGSLTAIAKPPAPVPLAQVANTAATAPFTLFTLLATDVSGAPGPAPTVIPKLPAVVTPPLAPDSDAAGDAPADQPDDTADAPTNAPAASDTGSPEAPAGTTGN